jgi:hypothetical protein
VIIYYKLLLYNNAKESRKELPKETLPKGLPLANIAFSPTCLNTSSGVHSAVTQQGPKLALHLRAPLKRKFHPWVSSDYVWVAEHKPLVVGLDIAKTAGRGESDSFIALRT